MKGGTMKITMGAAPNKEFGSAKEDRPYDKY
jgi:putative alpha-1,2-mannosidase